MNQRLAGILVLVADDQSDVARTLCRPLQKAGARIHFVADGQAALEIWFIHTPSTSSSLI